MHEPVLELSGVSFSYGDKAVLEDINLIVNSGDFLGIVGPNGSGKSTLLKIIVGLLRPATGTVKLFGIKRHLFREWTRVGYVPQKVTAFNHGFPATAEEVVMSGLTAMLGVFKRPGRHERQMVDEAMENTGVSQLRKRIIGELSGGQQQRVFIARALVSRPQMLILDEPTVGVDVEAQGKFYELLAELRREQGITLLMVSHDIGVVTEKVQSVACLNKKLYFHGSPEDFWAGENLSQLYGSPVRALYHAH